MDFRRTPSSSQKKKFQKDKAMGRNRNTSLLAFCCTNHNSLWRCCGTFGKEGGSFVSFRKNFIMYAIRKTATILYHVVVPFLNFNSCQSYFPEDLFHILRTFWNKVPPPFRILYDIYSGPNIMKMSFEDAANPTRVAFSCEEANTRTMTRVIQTFLNTFKKVCTFYIIVAWSFSWFDDSCQQNLWCFSETDPISDVSG